MNSFYQHGIDAIGQGQINLATDTIKAVFLTSSYTPNFSTDQHYSDIPGGDVLGTPTAVAGQAILNGLWSITNTNLSGITGTITYVLFYKDTGTPSTSPLIYLADTGTGIPVTVASATVTIAGGTIFAI